MNYIISYDLIGESKNYKAAEDAIALISTTRFKPCTTTWVVESDLESASSIYDAIKDAFNKTDKILIAETSDNMYVRSDVEACTIAQNFFS